MANPGARKGPSKKWLSLLFVALLALVGLSGSTTTLSKPPTDDPVADMTITAGQVEWQAKVTSYAGLELVVAGPGDLMYRQVFKPGQPLVFGVTDEAGQRRPDGVYNYELVVQPMRDDATRASREAGGSTTEVRRLVQSGHFAIQNGAFVTGGAEPQSDSTPLDQIINDDLIVTGSECIGFDCVNGEAFGYCTQKYKENNLQVCFEDTSVGTFPTNDWKIQINDTTSGGASYFTIWDTDGGRRPFTIEAGAPAHSLYVEDYGRVGLGTSVPYVELHIVDDDSPTVRLEQDGSGGWTPQTWDLASNETNFFIRDVTNGSKLSLRIQPGAPSNSLTIKNDGKIGMGTWNPDASLEVETTGSNAKLLLQRTDGATFKLVATTGKVAFGSETNHRTEFLVNDSPHTTFETNGDVTVESGEVTAVAFNPTSDVNAKENFAPVDGKEVLDRLADVPITTWNFKDDEGKARHMGPTAQDFGAFGLGKDDKHISTMDADGVALAAIKELDARNKALETRVTALESEKATLRREVDEMKTRLAALEARVTGGKAPAAEPVPSGWLPDAGLLLAGLTLPAGAIWMIRQRRNR